MMRLFELYKHLFQFVTEVRSERLVGTAPTLRLSEYDNQVY
jgi:hypothetical protein